MPMYFSKIQINKGVMNPFQLSSLLRCGVYGEHKLIWKFFPDNKNSERDFLFRRFGAGEKIVYYLLSGRRPLNENGEWKIETKQFDPVITKGMKFSFNLRANPVITNRTDNPSTNERKRNDVYMNALAKYKASPEMDRPSNNEILMDSGLEWLEKRSEQNGFIFNREQVIVDGYQKMEGSKGKTGHRIQIGVIDYSGVLMVDNSERFKNMLFSGIGKSRAFGCGLLLIKRIG